MTSISLTNGTSSSFPSSTSTALIANSSRNAQNQSEVLQMFYNKGPSPWLIGLFGLKVIISCVGIFLNANLVFVTFTRKSLNSVCHRLLAFYALCAIFQQANFFGSFAVVLFSSSNFISYRTCFAFQFLPIFCSFMAFPLTFFIALERLLSVNWPIWYKQRNKQHVMAMIMSFCAFLGLYVLFKDFQTAMETPNLPVMCAVGPKNDDSWVTYLILAFNLFSISAYLAIWIRVKAAPNKFSKYQTRLLQCLSVLLLLELFGWLLSIVLRVSLSPIFGIQSGTFANFLVINLATNLAYIAMSLTLPVLYVFSQVHREILREHFGHLKLGMKEIFSMRGNRISNNNNSVNALNSSNQNPTSQQSNRAQINHHHH